MRGFRRIDDSLFDQEVLMRSDLVFGATTHVPNRFLLTQLASKAVRKVHRPGTRMQDTANSVFAHFSFSNPLREKQVECSNLSIVQMPKARPWVDALRSDNKSENAA
jgi:hypothetical protein